MQGGEGAARRIDCRAGDAGEKVELKMVRRQEGGGGQSLIAHEIGDAVAQVNPALDVAEDRITAVDGFGILRLHGADRAHNRCADGRRAHIAGEHAVTAAEDIACAKAGDAVVDQAGVEHRAAPIGIARVVREMHGMDRPDLAADPLQRKHRRRIADMAVDDMALDREDRQGPGRGHSRHQADRRSAGNP
jgi:hypothetical protein